MSENQVQEADLISRVKSYASSVQVSTTPWLTLLMDDVLTELERLRQIDATADNIERST